jgi:hypothetical protein
VLHSARRSVTAWLGGSGSGSGTGSGYSGSGSGSGRVAWGDVERLMAVMLEAAESDGWVAVAGWQCGLAVAVAGWQWQCGSVAGCTATATRAVLINHRLAFSLYADTDTH